MMDKLSQSERSRNMSAIRGRNTKPELLIRKWLFARGYRYRINVNYIPGHPDLFLRKYNTAVFINGCFWHRHPGCKYSYTPKSNVDFWLKKFEDNVRRDDEVHAALNTQGIRRLVIWECTIRKMARNVIVKDEILDIIDKYFLSTDKDFEI